jgi:hypothetical protein
VALRGRADQRQGGRSRGRLGASGARCLRHEEPPLNPPKTPETRAAHRQAVPRPLTAASLQSRRTLPHRDPKSPCITMPEHTPGPQPCWRLSLDLDGYRAYVDLSEHFDISRRGASRGAWILSESSHQGRDSRVSSWDRGHRKTCSKKWLTIESVIPGKLQALQRSCRP